MNAIGRLGQTFALPAATQQALAAKAGIPYREDTWEDWQADEQAAAEKAGQPPIAPMAPPAEGDTIISHGRPSEAEQNGVSMTPAEAPTQAEPTSGAPEGYTPAPQPSVTIPAHWQGDTRKVDVHGGLDPEALTPGLMARDAGFKVGEMSAAKQYEAARLNDEVDKMAARRAADEQAAVAAKAQALASQKQQYMTQEHQKLDALNLESQRKVDTNEAFRGGDAGRIMAAVFMGMGQFAAVLGHTENGAMKIVNDAINSTIDRQKANAAGARGAFADRMNLYRDNLQHFDDQQAQYATRIQLLDSVAKLADARRASARDAQTDAGYLTLIQGIDNAKADALEKFGTATGARIDQSMSEKFHAAQTLGGGGAQPKREGNLVTLSDGTTFVMPSSEQAEKSIEKIQTLDQLQRNGNEILRLRKKAASLDPLMDHTEYKKTLADLQDLGTRQTYLTARSMNVPTKGDAFDRIANAIGDTTAGLGTFKGNPISEHEREVADSRFQADVRRAGEDQRAFVKSAGGSVYQRSYGRDASGNLVPTGNYTGQDATPDERMAPHGSKPLGKGHSTPIAPAKMSTELPRSPVVPGVVVTAGKKGKKGSTGSAAAPPADDDGED